MRIVAGAPCSAAARASACAWLPEDAATTPRSRSALGSEATALYAPRNLKAPTRCRFSGLRPTVAPVRSSRVREVIRGVRCAVPSRRAAARLTSSRSITPRRPPASRRGRDVLGGGDQVADGRLVPPPEQLDRVGIAVHDALEELLAVLVGGQRALRPAADLVQQHGEARIGLAELVGDLALDPLGERGRGARGRDGDGQRARADDGGEDEVAQRRYVDDVDEHRPLLGGLVDGDVRRRVVRRRDRDERLLEVARLVAPPDPLDRALGGERLQLRHRVGRHEHHPAVAGEQALDLLQPDLPAPDDDAAAARQPEARDVERRLQHSLHAGLVADPAMELADALLAPIRGGRHRSPRYYEPYPRMDGTSARTWRTRWGRATSTTIQWCGACIARASSRCPARGRCSCRPRTRSRSQASSPTPACSTSRTSAWPAPRR